MSKSIIFIVLMALCSPSWSISKKACENTDWYEKSIKLMAQGKNSNIIKKFERECKKKSAEFDRETFQKAWDAGIQIECAHQKAFDEGLDKSKKRKNCGDAQDEYNKYYDYGLELKSLKSSYKKESRVHKKMKNKHTRLTQKLKTSEDKLKKMDLRMYEIKNQTQLRIPTLSE